MKIEPITLEGSHVRLVPLEVSHTAALCDVGLIDDIWTWTTTKIKTSEDMAEYVLETLRRQESGTALPFATVDRSSGTIIGSTRFGTIDIPNRKVEIGWTWINPKWQRTSINTEAKLLMLRHAFEHWKCIRVEIITDVHNEISRRAILRLGAKEEGVLRNHLIVPGGRIRDSVVHSIIESEWPAVREKLTEKLGSYK